VNRDVGSKMESFASLQEVLKQAQETWRDANRINRALKMERVDLDGKLLSLRLELETATRREADGQRDAASASLLHRPSCTEYRLDS
jgi:hypothetical protein